jgi:type I restriction enzyme S subunit
MHNWQQGVIGNLAHGVRGVSYRPEHLRTSFALDVAILLRSTNIQGGEITFDNVQYVPSFLVSDDQIVNQHDIVVCMSNGSKALVGKSAPCRVQPRSLLTIGAFCSVFHPLPGVNPSFLFHVFNCYSFRKYIDVTLAGSAINNLRNNAIEQFDCLIPNIDEQSRIAAVLDTIDETIAKTEAVIEKLRQVRIGLLHDLLTCGLDEHGHLRDPIAHPEQFQASPLGRIPKAWEIVSLSLLGNIVTGATPPSSVAGSWGRKLPFVTPVEIKGDGTILPPERYLSDSGCQFVRELPTGAVLVVCIGSTLGKVSVSPWPCATNQQINALVCSSSFDAAFVASMVSLNIKQLHCWAGLQAVPIIKKSQFGKMLIPVAPTNEQQRIVEFISISDQDLSAVEQERKKLISLKSGLMDDLLKGRVRVPEEV